MIQLGDYVIGDVFYFYYTTRAKSGDPANPSTAPTTVYVYRNDGTSAGSNRTTTGVTLTGMLTGNEITGLNALSITTSDAFYTAGSEFHIVCGNGTIDGVPMAGEVLARFTIQRFGGSIRVALGMTVADIAKTIWNFDMNAASADTVPTVSPRSVMRKILNWAISGTGGTRTLSVKKENGTTEAFTSTLTIDGDSRISSENQD